MPDRSSSKNPYINGTKDYNRSREGILCVKCGYVGHTSKECTGDVLPAWKQAYEAWCLVMFLQYHLLLMGTGSMMVLCNLSALPLGPRALVR